VCVCLKCVCTYQHSVFKKKMSSYDDLLGDDNPAAAAETTKQDRAAVTSVYLSSPPVFQQPNSEKYQVQVCNPQKQTDKSRSYVAYTVRVRKVKDGVESSSFRRFSDFLWIHDQLVQKYPSCVIPPMPEKSLTGNFSPELMMFRSRELTRFLQRVAAHPTLSSDDDFEFFLMAPWDDFTVKRSTSGKESVVGTIFNQVTKMVSGKVEDEDQWFVQLAADLGNRKKLLEGIQESAAGMVAGWRELSQLYSSQGQQLQALSKFFGDSEASRCGEDAQAMQSNVAVLDEFATHLEHSYLDNMRDYLREITAIETVLSRRTDLLKEVASQKKAADKKGGDAQLAYQDSVQKLDNFSKEARQDIQRVLDTRQGELERIIIGFAQMHRDCFTRTGSDWTSAINASGLTVSDDSSSRAAATTTTTTTTSLNNAESAGPFSSAVFDGVPSSPYATGDD